MERILILLRASCSFFVGLLVGAVVFSTPTTLATTYTATSYTGKEFTGYANGTWNGANGSVQIVRGDFANHPAGYCYDPAGYWPWGTQITSISPSVRMVMLNGSVQYYPSLYLYDNGDYNCLKQPYWVDVYFGRSLPNSSTSCACIGNDQCYIESTYSCQNAWDFGNTYGNYVGP